MNVRDHPDPGRRLLRRARRLVTLQIAGLVSLVLALAGTLVYAVTVHGQDAAAREDLAAASRAAPVAHPPRRVWIVEVRGDVVRRSPGAPPELPFVTGLTRVAGSGRSVAAERAEIGGRDYLVHTERRGDTVVQAVMDLRRQNAERRRLLRTLAVTEVGGVLGSLLVGQALARRAVGPLGEALERQQRFVADASHELRTPLARLHTRAQLIAHRLRQGDDVTQEVDRLVAGTRQFGEVVDDLLLSARFARTGRPCEPVDLAALAEEAAVAEAPRAQARGVAIEVRRQGHGGHVVRGVEPALRRMVSALLDNALGHTGEGGHIRVTLTGGGPAVTLTVRDDGEGLDPRDAERLFTRFAGGPGGFGLGLALVREVVEGHGGTITADGRPGAGAAFTVRLPAARKTGEAGEAPGRSRPA
ncbi:HAMP domain-containing sensor histidine kinase [Actinomadura fulvescens]|uniref:Sensor-like histidine kinase SenX3 n=1 Tax=Actinomadura fulvescens TaxID=46160 RepID=A0ABP6CKS1_9ACTN